MPRFKIHDLDDAPAASQPLLRGMREQLGFVPNLAATMAGSPALLQAFLGLRAAAQGGTLDAASREVIAVAVAQENGCAYCEAAHSTFALKQGAAAETVSAVRARRSTGDRRLDALAAFGRAVVLRRQAPERAQDLVDAGLTPAQVLEALVAIAIPMLAGSVFQLERVVLDAPFEPQAVVPA